MADDKKSKGLDKPAGASKAAKADETEIHVIPDEFYGAPANRRPKSKPKKTAEQKKQVSGASKTPTDKKKSKTGLFIAIAAIVLLLGGGGVAAYFLFLADEGPVCGDGTCAQSETHDSCPEDCEPPPPECGNGECEESENHISCPEDCEPPPPVCGDGACDAEETFESCPEDCEPPPVVCGDGVCESNRGETYQDCPEDCEPPPPNPADDTDSDGLTDAEETEIYGSDPNSSNSDGDSFVDLNEVLNLFDPASPEPAKLADNPGIVTYESVDFGIRMLMPESWGVREAPTDRMARFTSPTGENVRVSLYDKDPEQALTDWLPDAPIEGVASISSFESLVNQKGYEQLITSDRRTIFVASNGTVVRFAYDLADELEIRYRVTLSMMANSLEFMEVESAGNSAGQNEESPTLPASAESEEGESGEESPAEQEEG